MASRHRFLAAVAVVLAATMSVSARADAASDYARDYANALLGEQLRRDRPDTSWLETAARRPVTVASREAGPRSWNSYDQNPWANTYGTPSTVATPIVRGNSYTNSWRATTLQPSPYSGPVRLCSCYLPSDAKSWDGGPLTGADVARMCKAQCY